MQLLYREYVFLELDKSPISPYGFIGFVQATCELLTWNDRAGSLDFLRAQKLAGSRVCLITNYSHGEPMSSRIATLGGKAGDYDRSDLQCRKLGSG
jgi:hypothetical protein